MNIVSSQDFAKLACVEGKHISTYLKRGKIFADKIIGEGKRRIVTFDTEHPANKAFLLSRLTSSKSQKQNPDESALDDISKIINDDDELKGLHPTLDASVGTKGEPTKISGYELDIALKRAELGIRNQKQEVNKLLLAKARRKLVSTDIVGRSVSEVVHRYQASMINEMDQLMRDTLNELQVDNVVLTKALSRITDIANEISERAINEAKIAIINSFSDSISLAK